MKHITRVFHYDIIALSETYLNESIKDEEIRIEGYSREIFRSDHHNDKIEGGVCSYFKENLRIKRRKDLEITQETVICEISIRRKKVFFCIDVLPTKVMKNLMYFMKTTRNSRHYQGCQTAWCYSNRRPELSF